MKRPQRNISPGAFLAQRHTPPFRHGLPGTMAEMLAGESWHKKLAENFKLLKRWLWLKSNLPSHLLSDRLPLAPARLLWLNYSSTSIGDSIMELAGRTLLGGYEIDLLTDKQHAELYRTDRYFGKVFTDAGELDATRYDFVLLDLFNTRSIRLKRRACPELPFACMQCFFYGADFNRMLFSCYRIHHLLGYPYNDEDLRSFLQPRLFLEADLDPLPPKRKETRCALLLGGVHAIKTYRRWPEVIQLLRARWPGDRELPEFTLVGSQNGLPHVGPVMTALAGCAATSHVGALTLRQTARALAACDFFIGTDGGLMHSAVALDVPGVAVFGKFLPPLYLPPKSNMHSVYDATDVNNVTPARVVEAILRHPWASGADHGKPTPT